MELYQYGDKIIYSRDGHKPSIEEIESMNTLSDITKWVECLRLICEKYYETLHMEAQELCE